MIRLILAFLLLWPSWAWAQMESSPGIGPAAARPYNFYGTNSVVGRFTEVPCTVNGTSGTLTLNLGACSGASSDVFHIGPLTGATTIVFTNPVPGQTVRLEIAANTQSVTLPPCIGPTSVAVSGNSFIVYDVFDSIPTYWCPAGVQAGLTPPNPAIVQTLLTAGNSSGSTTQSVTLTGFGPGHTAVFVIAWCGASGCVGNGTETITSATATGGTCTQITNSFTGVATPQPVYMYRCTGMSAGNVTFTGNWSATAFFPTTAVAELSNDNGAEAGAAATANSAAPAVTSGVLSQVSGELVIAYGYPLQTITAVQSPFTLISFGGGSAFGWYSVPTCSSCTETATFTESPSGQWSAVIAGFKHP